MGRWFYLWNYVSLLAHKSDVATQSPCNPQGSTWECDSIAKLWQQHQPVVSQAVPDLPSSAPVFQVGAPTMRELYPSKSLMSTSPMSVGSVISPLNFALIQSAAASVLPVEVL